MCRFIETICVKAGVMQFLKDHQKRMDETIHQFFDSGKLPDLKEILIIPEIARKDWHKCRIIYSNKIEEITWEPYQVRKISTLKLVHVDDIEYSWKYANRSMFAELIHQAGTDDIIIVKNGCITDCSYANLLFRRHGNWYTPSTPLLPGTQRNRLLKSGKIKEELIRPEDLKRYDKVKFINAMLDLKTGPEYAIGSGQWIIRE